MTSFLKQLKKTIKKHYNFKLEYKKEEKKVGRERERENNAHKTWSLYKDISTVNNNYSMSKHWDINIQGLLI